MWPKLPSHCYNLMHNKVLQLEIRTIEQPIQLHPLLTVHGTPIAVLLAAYSANRRGLTHRQTLVRQTAR